MSYKSLITFLILLTVLKVGYCSDTYTISQMSIFESSQRITDVCKVQSSDTLIPQSLPVKLKPGECILRKKMEQNGYSLFKGYLDTNAFYRDPPLFSFPIPSWADLNKFLEYRLFTSPTVNKGNDEPIVYFDNERVYIQQFKSLYYMRYGNWFELKGNRQTPLGSLSITSVPLGASVSLNGIPIEKKTPCIVEQLPAGNHSVELFLPNHNFATRSVKIKAQEVSKISFELISDIDTVYITGSVPFGLLLLPQPPTDSSYRIDNVATSSLQQKLLPGVHHIFWNGAGRYKSIDTSITIPERKVTYFDIQFKRMYGLLKVYPLPYDTKWKIADSVFVGDQGFEIATGNYILLAEKKGYLRFERDVTILADSISTLYVSLIPHQDKDRDGFADSIDNCPDRYGLYDGCPKRRLHDAIEIKKEELLDYVKSDPLELGFSMIGLISRIPTRKQFANFLSSFSSGRPGGINNYRGLTIANSFHLMFHGAYGSIDLGQWSSGLSYKRDDTLVLKNNSSNSNYFIYYDSLSGVKPVLYIPSTSFCIGTHFSLSWINVVYGVGYQWEDIVLYDVYEKNTGTLSKVVFDNDFWFHQLQLESDLKAEALYVPGLYVKFKLPFSQTRWTRWNIFQVGLQMKFYPPKHYRSSKHSG